MPPEASLRTPARISGRAVAHAPRHVPEHPPVFNRHRTAALAAAIITAISLTSVAQAQDFTEESRFEVRLSAFNSDSSIRLAGTGVATDGERTESAEGAGTLDIGDRWRPRAEILFRMTPRQTLSLNHYDLRRDRSWRFDGDWIDPGGIFDEVDVPGDPVEVPSVDLTGRVNFKLSSLNYDFAIVDTPTFEWGLGIGLTQASLDIRATGTTSGTAELDPEWEEVRWSRTKRSPGVNTRLTWVPAPRWRIEAQGQYFNTNWGNFVEERGHFERAGLNVEYLVTDSIAVHAGYDWFRLKLANDYRASFDAPDETDIGTIDLTGTLSGQLKVNGPTVGLTFRF